MKRIQFWVLVVLSVVFMGSAVPPLLEFSSLRDAGVEGGEVVLPAWTFGVWFVLSLWCGDRASALVGFRWWVPEDTREGFIQVSEERR